MGERLRRDWLTQLDVPAARIILAEMLDRRGVERDGVSFRPASRGLVRRDEKAGELQNLE